MRRSVDRPTDNEHIFVKPTIITGDCRTALAAHGPFDMLLADPPYGDTSLAWDKRVDGWVQAAYDLVAPNGSMWVFGSMRYFIDTGAEFAAGGWKLAQDVVWEKHNGSGLHGDRFKRVHEHAIQFYRSIDKWADVFNEVQKTNDATARTVRRKTKPQHHQGTRGESYYESEDGGPRIMRSVIFMRSMHGRAIHPGASAVKATITINGAQYVYPDGPALPNYFVDFRADGSIVFILGTIWTAVETHLNITAHHVKIQDDTGKVVYDADLTDHWWGARWTGVPAASRGPHPGPARRDARLLPVRGHRPQAPGPHEARDLQGPMDISTVTPTCPPRASAATLGTSLMFLPGGCWEILQSPCSPGRRLVKAAPSISATRTPVARSTCSRIPTANCYYSDAQGKPWIRGTLPGQAGFPGNKGTNPWTAQQAHFCDMYYPRLYGDARPQHS
jgi:site-specific DNA-methyltransferase (adenine-specific)